jgi:hypothetical protein
MSTVFCSSSKRRRTMLKKWFAVGIVLLLMSVLMAGCGISQEKYDASIADLAAVQKEIQTVKSDLQASAAKVSELTSSQEKTKADLGTAQAKNTELTMTLASKQAELSSAQAVNTGLKQDIEVLQTRNSWLVSRIPTLVYNTYVDNDKGFSINYPADWEKQQIANTLVSYVGRGLPVNFLVVSETLPQTKSAQAYFESGKQGMLNSGYTFAGSKELTINQMTAFRGIFTKNEVTQAVTSLVRGTTGWIIVCTARSSDFMDYSFTFNEIISSFKLTK